MQGTGEGLLPGIDSLAMRQHATKDGCTVSVQLTVGCRGWGGEGRMNVFMMVVMMVKGPWQGEGQRRLIRRQ